MDDTSLEDFLDTTDEDGEAADDGGADGDDADGAAADGTDAAAESATSDPAASAPDVEPATTTYRWTPTGATCTVCGEQTQRCWGSAEGLVCPDCKEW